MPPPETILRTNRYSQQIRAPTNQEKFESGDAETQEAGEAGICHTGRGEQRCSEETSRGDFPSRMQRAPDRVQDLGEAILRALSNGEKNAAPSQILVTGTIEISDTIVISDSRNVSIAAAEDGTVIKRADGFLDDMFMVQGRTPHFSLAQARMGIQFYL